MTDEFDGYNPEEFYPLWSETRMLPFRRSPYSASTYEMAIGAADQVLAREAILSQKAGTLLSLLRNFVTIEDQRESGGYQWTPVAGIWVEKHPAADSSPKWAGRSLVRRDAFTNLWEQWIAPYIHALNREEEL